MGRMLGAFDPEDELDRPDLNRCPDCGCFFAQTHCPLCGKECPEEMRAGNRKPIKKKKPQRGNSGRVTFIDWYHSWWFIILMLIVFPLVGIVLLVTSPHKKSVKIAIVTVGVVYTVVVSYIGIGNIIFHVKEWIDPPVESSLSFEEYAQRCETLASEDYYRASASYEDRFVSMRLRVVGVARGEYGPTYNETYYVCEGEGGQAFRILVRDCFLGQSQNLMIGDVITVYGEGAEMSTVYDAEYNEVIAPCINGAYLELEK